MAVSDLIPEAVDPNMPPAPQAPAAQGQVVPKTKAEEQAPQDPTAWKPFAAPDPTTGKTLVRDHDGGVFLQSGSNVQKFSPQEASNLLSNQFGEYHPADIDTVDKFRKDNLWNKATFAEKSDFVARRVLTNIADGVAPVVRAGTTLGYGLAGKVSPLDGDLSGEKLLEKLDGGIATVLQHLGLSDGMTAEQLAAKSAQNTKELAQAAPGINAAASIAGFVIGGELGAASRTARGVEQGAAAIAEALGVSGEKALKLGKYASEIATGAGINAAANNDNAWINDEQLTAESQLHALGIGALWGAGGQLAADALKGGLNRAAKVFGPAREAAMTGEEKAVNGIAERVTGTEPAGKGFSGFLKGRIEWIRNKIEEAQSRATGASLEDIQSMGGLRFSEEAKQARALYQNRDALLEQGAKDLHGALKDLHAEGQEIYHEAIDSSLKEEHIKALLKDADHNAIMSARADKLNELENGYAQLDQVSKTDRSVLGSGKQLADIKAAYEEAHIALTEATKPEQVFKAMDQFKRATQRAKVNAQQSAGRVTSGIEMQQAQNRAQLMFQVSENAREFLTSDVFGAAGEAQKAINSRFNQMIDSDAMVRSKLFENTGRVSQGERFGATRFEVAPDRVKNFVDGLGTTKTQVLEGKLRDNVANRVGLAEEMVKHFNLSSSHAEQLQKVIESGKKTLKILDDASTTIAWANKGDAIAAAQAKNAGHGVVGAMIAGMMGHALGGIPGAALSAKVAEKLHNIVVRPGTMMDQAIAMQHIVERSQERIQSSVKSALRLTESNVPTRVAETVLSRKVTAEKQQARATKVLRVLNEYKSDPAQMIDHVGALTGHIDHPGVQQASTTTALTGIQFLMGKMPQPLYQNSVPTAKADNFVNISATQRDVFLNYVSAVQRPLDFFKDLADGTATAQQAEVAQALAPKHFALAQQAAVMSFAEGKTPGTFQQRMKVQRLLRINIEPSLQPGLQSFIAQNAQQAANRQAMAQQVQQQLNSPGAPSAAKNLASPLNSLKVN